MQRLFRHRHQFDHAFIGLAGVIAKRKNAVLEQHHADGVGVAFTRKGLGAIARQVETRHEIGNHHTAIAIQLADARLAIGGVTQAHHSIGMGVIDIFVGQAAMQNGLNRRPGRAGTGHAGGQLVDHVRVGQHRQLRQLQHMRQPHRREALRLDRLEVPATALDVQHILFFAKDILLADFHRGVATAMQYQRLVAAEQARGVDTGAKFAGPLCGVGIVPKTLHTSGLSISVTV